MRLRKLARTPVVRVFAVGLLAILAYSSLIEPRMLEITEHEIFISGLPTELDGFTIAQVSDVHVGISIRPKGVVRMAQLVNSLDPDLIVLTGDYVNRIPANIEPAGEALSHLRAEHGVYAVLGNHDYWTDAKRMTRALLNADIHVLVNENRLISHNGAAFRLVGIDDEWAGRPDVDKAFEGVADDEISVVLAHHPASVLRLEGKPADLLLAGHTHGGQINLPLIGPIYTPTRLPKSQSVGMSTFGRTTMYVSRGTGFTTPIRFRSRPEIPIFTLRMFNARE